MTIDTGSRVYTLGEAAELVGCHPDSIRNAERAGRLAEPRRNELGQRTYDQWDIQRLRIYFGRD